MITLVSIVINTILLLEDNDFYNQFIPTLTITLDIFIDIDTLTLDIQLINLILQNINLTNKVISKID